MRAWQEGRRSSRRRLRLTWTLLLARASRSRSPPPRPTFRRARCGVAARGRPPRACGRKRQSEAAGRASEARPVVLVTLAARPTGEGEAGCWRRAGRNAGDRRGWRRAEKTRETIRLACRCIRRRRNRLAWITGAVWLCIFDRGGRRVPSSLRLAPQASVYSSVMNDELPPDPDLDDLPDEIAEQPGRLTIKA